jgi:hypothetical protein
MRFAEHRHPCCCACHDAADVAPQLLASLRRMLASAITEDARVHGQTHRAMRDDEMGDEIKVKGRLWTGEGAMGAGTIFVSDVVVSKRPLADTAVAQPGPQTVGAR